jgi:phosphohistidine phosphatase
LLRHAKSSWKDRGQADHDRPLAGRGRRAATAVGRHLREQGIEPELALCSTARRTRETLERIEPALGAADVRFEPALYAASADALLERLHDIPETVGSVMLIGRYLLSMPSNTQAHTHQGWLPEADPLSCTSPMPQPTSVST